MLEILALIYFGKKIGSAAEEKSAIAEWGDPEFTDGERHRRKRLH